MPNYQEIDLTNWPRAMHCQIFRAGANGQYCVGFELDITEFLAAVKANGWSFTLAMTFAVAKCANAIPEFRYRFLDGKVVQYEHCDTSFTYFNDQTELFKVVIAPFVPDLAQYVQQAKQLAANQTACFTGPLPNDVFQFSALPWVPFTYITHTDSGKKDQAMPLFDWGQYTVKNGRIILPFSCQVHHSFVDGWHIGKFYQALQQYLTTF